MRRKRRLRVLTLGVLLAALPAGLLAACSPPIGDTGPQPSELAGWLPVELPEKFRPGSLAADGATLWVGGGGPSTPVNRGWPDWTPPVPTPRGWLRSRCGRSARTRRTPSSSPWRSRGDEVSALGGVRDGAHSNVRWSVWSGTARGLQEFPQGFNTFGGPEAGDLVGIVHPETSPDAGPVIVGTWSSRHGLDAAFLAPPRSPLGSATRVRDGAGQQRHRADLAPRGDQLRLARGGARLGARAGARHPPGGHRLDLAVADPAMGAGRAARCRPRQRGPRRRAATPTPAGCSARWTSKPPRGSPTLADRHRVPDLPASGLRATDGAAAFRVAGHVGAIFSDGIGGRLLLQTDRGWRLFSTPAGSVGPAVAVGNRIYVVVEDGERSRLWSCDVSSALQG